MRTAAKFTAALVVIAAVAALLSYRHSTRGRHASSPSAITCNGTVGCPTFFMH